MKLFSFFYNVVFVPFFIIFNRILSPFIPKLKERNRDLLSSLNALDKLNRRKKTIWFHSSSMGEFEQAKPIIERIKSSNPEVQILCTFFSPSGFRTQKNYEFADAISYLPFDSRKNVRNFIEKAQPDIAIFVRYEIWFNYLSLLSAKNIKTILINATFPSAIRKFSFLGKIYRFMFNLFDEIYTISEEHFLLFSSLDISAKLFRSHDTRFERIFNKVSEYKSSPIFPKSCFLSDTVLVAGSTWTEDEIILVKSFNSIDAPLTLIIVPHEPTPSHISQLRKKLPHSYLLSDLLSRLASGEEIKISKGVIVVDSIGYLLKLYANADIAYIGGSFGAGVHSLAEPAGYGIPLITGKNCMNSPDTPSLLSSGALHTICDASELTLCLERLISDQSFRELSGKSSALYIQNNLGATDQILTMLYKHLDLVIPN
ncbi:MAG: hypothetical protein GX372_07490 [Ignavibacteria bacterium]|jgi:3-deoxy-D-manno-octulosonic-acid transferase|nr:hypothetical protein [Ignavibacteria bacterium]